MTTLSKNVLIDKNESLIFQVMSNYEQTRNLTQKLDLLKGGKVKLLAIHQTGSKFLQKILDNANPQTIEFILKEVLPEFPQVMVDSYGNYFCQKLVECISQE